MPITTNVIQPRHKYDPIDRCIYCGEHSLQLGDEHIVPFSLGGQLVLPKASCRKCEKVTGHLETRVGRTLTGNFRMLTDVPTRRPKERPETINVSVFGETEEVSVKAIPLKDYPQILALPLLPPAKIFLGDTPQPQPQIWFAVGKEENGENHGSNWRKRVSGYPP